MPISPTIAKRQVIQTLGNIGLGPIARRIGLRVKSFGIPIVAPIILRHVPHDRGAFTQGLAYEDGTLFESTGLAHESSLRQIDPNTGAVVRRIAVKDSWAEGIALLGNKLIQLTYRDEKAFVYSLPELEQVGELRYKGEGWGLTSQSDRVWMSNGTNVLVCRDAAFEPIKSLSVTVNRRPVERLNDLVFARGRLFANVLHERSIYEIDSRSGEVTRIIDCSELDTRSNPKDPDNIMNGIAYDSDKDTFYLTGKNWPSLFEVSISD